MKCNHCQQQHPQYTSYCPNTGRRIEDGLISKYAYQSSEFCVSCGTGNPSGYSNCVSCGTSTIKVAAKKISIDKILDQSMQSIPDITNNLKEQVNKTNMKNFFSHHLSYIKSTPMILVPALVSIVLVLIVGFMMVSGMQKNMDLIADLFDGEIAYFLDGDMLSSYLSEEFGIDIDAPKFPITAIIILLLHNVSFALKGKFTQDIDVDSLLFEQSNVLFGLLFVPVVMLIIGAVVYGWLAKKNGWKFWYGIGYSTILYTLFLIITSVIARYSVKAQGRDYYYDELVKINLKMSPSIGDSIITGILLPLIIFSFFGYIVYKGKGIITALESEWKYFKYIMYSLAATVVGLIIHYVHAIIVLKKHTGELAESFIGMYVVDQIPQFLYYVASAYLAVFNWNFSLFGKLDIQNAEDYGRANFQSYAWFFNSGNRYELIDFKDFTTLVSPIIFVIITIAILGGMGYLLTKYDLLPLKEIAIVAGIFTAIQVVILIFFNANINAAEDGEQMFKLNMHFAYIRTVITTMIVAFASIYGGSFLKTKLKK